MVNELKKIFSKFQIEGEFINARPYGNGHINDTFLVKSKEANTEKWYIFQKINTDVLSNPEKLMENIVRVTTHIRSKLLQQGYHDINRRVLTVIKTNDGKNYYRDADGNCWRAYIFIENARTYDVPESTEQIYQAGKAFGKFQEMLVDLPAPPLFETIPDFHNGQKRFEIFRKALEADEYNRAADAKQEINFLKEHAWIFNVLPSLQSENKIPLRTTHNDTKINNVMIDDKTSEGICVIDLDTVMPGLSLYDFGDMVRTTVSDAQEDEPDTSRVYAELSRFEAILKGYLSAAGKFLNKSEKEHLVFSGKMITLMIGTRFLTDFLGGDKYFKVHRENHNLQRCRTQFKIVQSITDQQDEMENIVKRTS